MLVAPGHATKLDKVASGVVVSQIWGGLWCDQTEPGKGAGKDRRGRISMMAVQIKSLSPFSVCRPK